MLNAYDPENRYPIRWPKIGSSPPTDTEPELFGGAVVAVGRPRVAELLDDSILIGVIQGDALKLPSDATSGGRSRR